MLQEKIEKSIYKIPFITKKVECYKINKRIKDVFNSAVYDQNRRISMAMMEGKKHTTFIFANDEYYFNPWNTYKKQYRQILLDMGMKYYKRYKIENRIRTLLLNTEHLRHGRTEDISIEQTQDRKSVV